MQTGDWETARAKYRTARFELTTVGAIVLRGARVTILECWRDHVLALVHECHQGVVKMKARLRLKVWWPGMDYATKQTCRGSWDAKPSMHHQALHHQINNPAVGATATLGSRPDGTPSIPEHLFNTVDYYSRFFEVNIVRSTTTDVIIHCLKSHLSRYSISESI